MRVTAVGSEVEPKMRVGTQGSGFAGTATVMLVVVLILVSSGGSILRAQTPATASRLPLWSPDGQRIAFLSSRDGSNWELYTMMADGSGQRRLSVSPANIQVYEFRWSPNSRFIVFHAGKLGDPNDLFVVSPDGGEPTRLTTTGREGSPRWSTDGQRIAFSSGRERTRQIYTMRPDGTDQRRVTAFRDAPDPWEVEWAPNGQIFGFESVETVQQGNLITSVRHLYLINVDGSGLRRLIPTINNLASFAWSPDSRLLLLNASLEGSWQIYVFDVVRGDRRRLSTLGTSGAASWSQDGRRIVFASDRDGSIQIYAMNLDGGEPTRLTTAGPNFEPVWSPDGQRIVFTSRRDGSFQIYVMNADGSGQTRLTSPP